jgi:hypothetical protein
MLHAETVPRCGIRFGIKFDMVSPQKDTTCFAAQGGSDMSNHPIYCMLYSAAFHHLRVRFVAHVTSIQSEDFKHLSSMVGL